MRILLTNDDGVHAPGLLRLYRELRGEHRITVVAPDRERSAVSHGITLDQPLRLQEVPVEGETFYAVSGLPADCVKLALSEILTEPPQLVLSGINRGGNAGINILYSGTVAAAVEGMVAGIKSVAVSLCSFRSDRYDPAAAFTRNLVRILESRPLPRWSMLNVNVPDLPAEEVKGVRITAMGRGRFQEFFERRTDTRQHDYFWMDGRVVELNESEELDQAAVRAGYISVTPLRFDLTDHELLQELNRWNLG